MIQRIQSIFLLIAIIVPIVLVFIPLGYVDTNMARYVYDSISLKEMVADGTSVIRLYYLAFCLFLTSVLSCIGAVCLMPQLRCTSWSAVTGRHAGLSCEHTLTSTACVRTSRLIETVTRQRLSFLLTKYLAR